MFHLCLFEVENSFFLFETLDPFACGTAMARALNFRSELFCLLLFFTLCECACVCVCVGECRAKRGPVGGWMDGVLLDYLMPSASVFRFPKRRTALRPLHRLSHKGTADEPLPPHLPGGAGGNGAFRHGYANANPIEIHRLRAEFLIKFCVRFQLFLTTRRGAFSREAATLTLAIVLLRRLFVTLFYCGA